MMSCDGKTVVSNEFSKHCRLMTGNQRANFELPVFTGIIRPRLFWYVRYMTFCTTAYVPSTHSRTPSQDHLKKTQKLRNTRKQALKLVSESPFTYRHGYCFNGWSAPYPPKAGGQNNAEFQPTREMNFLVPKTAANDRKSEMTERKPGRPRQKGPTKVPITIRLDIDVLSALKLSGPGWQTRVNRVVRKWILDEDSANQHCDHPKDTSRS
jgi:uncharacterized protein (DUF4415 family)